MAAESGEYRHVPCAMLMTPSCVPSSMLERTSRKRRLRACIGDATKKNENAETKLRNDMVHSYNLAYFNSQCEELTVERACDG